MRQLHQQFRHHHDLYRQHPGYHRRRHRCQHCDRIRRRQHRIVRWNLEGSHRLHLIHRLRHHQYLHCYQFHQNQYLPIL